MSTISFKEVNSFLTEANDLCKKAVFKAAKKLKKKSFDDIDSYVEALGESKFPKKYKKSMIKIIDKFGDKLGAEEKFEADDLKLISDIPEELVGLFQLSSWIGECLPKKFKDTQFDVGKIYSSF